MRKVLFFLSLLFLMIFSINASADTIVDTGAGSTDVRTGYHIKADQWLSAEFTIDFDYTITDIMGWLSIGREGDLTISIYGDDGDVPDVNDKLFTTSVFLTTTPDSAGWHGISGIEWDLSAGTYWVAFEVLNTNLFAYANKNLIPEPLDNYAIRNSSSSYSWTSDSHLDIGVKIGANQNLSTVPEPATILLLGSGLIGIAGLSRKKYFNKA